MSTGKDAASRIERTLLREVLRGDHDESAKLPTVRALATRFGVNATTIQRALARLEATRLVTARQGSGIHVEDPVLVGEVSLTPALLDACLDDPPRAVKLLSDFLEVRRSILVSLITDHRDEIVAARSLAEGVTKLQNAKTLEERLAADMDYSRQFVQIAGNNTAAMWLLNTIRRVLETVPQLAEAYYAEPDQFGASNLILVHAMMTVKDEAQLAYTVRMVLRNMDESIINRFEQSLGAAADA